jgi:thioredoxin-related protein
MKHLAVTLLVFFSVIESSAQLKSMTFDELNSVHRQKPTLIFIYTDWCNYCHKMINTTLKEPDIINLINENFYYIPFNAETKRSIQFLNYEFSYIPNGMRSGVHELASQLASINGRVSYPSLSILNSQNEIIFQIASFLEKEALLEILRTTLGQTPAK